MLYATHHIKKCHFRNNLNQTYHIVRYIENCYIKLNVSANVQ